MRAGCESYKELVQTLQLRLVHVHDTEVSGTKGLAVEGRMQRVVPDQHSTEGRGGGLRYSFV